METAERFIVALRAGEPQAVDAANRLLRTMGRKHPVTHVTARQGEVLHLVACGLSDREIAARLFIEPDTAKHHFLAAKRALGGRSRAHTVVLWLASKV